MKTKHLEYLDAIGIKDLIRERVEEIHKFYSEICPEEIEDLFISEYIKEDGTRVYQDLRFYSKNFVMLASNFLHEDKFNFARLAITKLLAIRVEKKKTTTSKRLMLNQGCSSQFFVLKGLMLI